MTPTLPTTERFAPRTALVLLSIAGLFAYYNSFHGAFVFDDMMYMVPHELNHPFTNALGVGRPIASLSLSVNYWLDGLNPRGYHLLNLTCHVLAAWTLFDLIRRTLLLPRFNNRFEGRATELAFAAALIWLVHPLQTQAVTYVVQRCESMAGLFMLLSLYAYLRGRTTTGRESVWYVASALAAGLAAGCKEHAIVMPALLVCYEASFLASGWREVLRRWWAFALVAAPASYGFICLITRGVFEEAGQTVGFGVGLFTPKTYALTQTQAILHYLKLSFWPSPLTLDYIDWRPPQSVADTWPTVVIVTAMLLVTVVGILRRTWWGFLAAWFFGILAPTSSFVPVQDAVVEHRMYLSLAAVVLFAAISVDTLFARLRAKQPESTSLLNRVAVGWVMLLAVMLGLGTVIRNEDYASSLALNRSNVTNRPNNFRAHHGLAFDLLQRGQYDEALVAADQSFALNQGYPPSRMVRAAVLTEMGKGEAAAAWFREADRLAPNDPTTIAGLGTAELLTGRFEDAVSALQKAKELKPQEIKIWLWLAVALDATGHPEEAAEAYRGALRLDPEILARWDDYARHLALARETPSTRRTLAVRIARSLTAFEPSRAEFRDTFAIALAGIEQFDAASKEAGKAADLAAQRGDASLAARIRARQALFQQKKKFLPEEMTIFTKVAAK